jgi:hypothetical protein
MTHGYQDVTQIPIFYHMAKQLLDYIPNEALEKDDDEQ